jgi:uncharacterized membrane protein
MSDTSATPAASSGGTVTIIYVLYLVGLVIGVTSLVAVIMAYINRDSGPEWTRSHYIFQVRTFWIGLLYGVVGFITVFVVVGWLILLFALVWMIVRCAKGLKFANAAQPYPNPAGWLW